jgi:conjugal transfer/entry exclusion protein
MEKEIKEFIEAQNKALVEDITGVIQNVVTSFESRLDKIENRMDSMEKTLRNEIGAVALEVLEVKQLVRRIDDRTQHQVEGLYEEIRVTQQEVANLQDHLGLPRSFPATA